MLNLTLRQYQTLLTEKTDSFFYKVVLFVSVVNDVDPVIVETWDVDRLIEEYGKCKHVLNIPDTYEKSIKIADKKLELIDFTQVTFGQFIDIEHYISNDYIYNQHKILSCLYLEHFKNKIYSDKLEDYGNINIDYRANLFQEVEAKKVLGALKSYLNFRVKLFDSYEMFKDPFEGVDVNEMSHEEREIYQEERKKSEENRDNQWLMMLDNLTNSDLTKYDAILGMNVFLVLNQYQIMVSRNKK